jgi:hypothetical protein
MMNRISITAVALLAISAACLADELPPGPLDLDEALVRQYASDLISGAASAYDCNAMLHSFRRLGTPKSPVYMAEVQMHGQECDEALLLLSRHGTEKNILFRRWEPAPDIHEIDPQERGN